MKIIGTDNLARETEADILVAENIKVQEFALAMVEALNAKFCTGDDSPYHFRVVNDDYRLHRGMEDLV